MTAAALQPVLYYNTTVDVKDGGQTLDSPKEEDRPFTFHDVKVLESQQQKEFPTRPKSAVKNLGSLGGFSSQQC